MACSSIRTRLQVAIATAPPEPPSPTTTATLGTPSDRQASVERAMASACPRSSASILWRDSGRRQDAATNMKITAQDLLRFGIIDGIIAEPPGGAHRDPAAMIRTTGDAIEKSIAGFSNMSRDEIRDARAEKFLAMGRKI